MKTACIEHMHESKTQLKNGGLKVTAARMGLLDIFKHAKKPLSVKEISKALAANIDQVTLYRNIGSLETLGIIRQINFQDRQTYYELHDDHHHHIVCENCGKVADVKNCKINLPRSSVKNSGFAKVSSHSLEFFGLCKSCAKK